MKTFLLFTAMLIGVLTVNAQLHEKISGKNSNHPNGSYDERDFNDQSQPHLSNLRDIVNLPLNEKDSVYDVYNQVWNYEYDVTHQYYSGFCKDSLVTYYFNGVSVKRDFFQWDSNGIYKVYTLNQIWDGTNWINNTDEQSPVQFGCYIDYILDRTWNGNSWDTVFGTKEVISFDGYSRISQRNYSHYITSQWKTYRIAYLHYLALTDTITGYDNYYYSTSSGQLTSARRDTQYVWLYFNSFCNYKTLEYLHQDYDIPTHTWMNANKYQYTGNQIVNTDTFYYYLSLYWNGAFYDSSFKHYSKHDYMGNEIEFLEQGYDAASQTWITDYAYKYDYTYGPNNETLRKAYTAFDCAPNFDSIVPCYVHLYSDFVACGATGVSQVSIENNEVRIFPNPARSYLTLSSPFAIGDKSVFVYNIQGNKMNADVSIKNSTAQINLQNLLPGFYTIQIIDNKIGECSVQRFVKEE